MLGLGLLAGCGDAFTQASGGDGTDAATSGDGAPAGDAGADTGLDAPVDDDARPTDAGASGDGSGMSDANDCGGSACQTGFACEVGVCVDRAAIHFSATENPSGNWSYGSSLSEGQTFTPYPLHAQTMTSLSVWNDVVGSLTPSIFFNSAATSSTYSGFSMVAKSLGLAPSPPPPVSTSPPNPDSILRWTCPAAGTYAADVTFTGLAPSGMTTTSVTVIITNQAVTGANAGSLNAYGEGNSFEFSQPATPLALGDTVDIYVIAIPSGMWISGYTGVEAHITGR